MKKTFIAGLATLLPITITIVVVVFVIDLLTAPFTGFVEEMISFYGGQIAEEHHYLLVVISRLIVLVLFVVLIFILGILGRRIFFSWFLKLTNRLLTKIPIVKTIYRISLDITKNVFSEEGKKLFKGTVLVPFPHQKTHAIGLLSGDPPSEVAKNTDPRVKDTTFQSIFVPTAPHPISGFLLMYSDKEVKTVDIETEDLFKFLLSCGIFQPGKKDDKSEDTK
ncbi:DUF502 domain-containing protein [Simkania negevensis]|uniref:DUF502 domain-containing protein n=1 Tax=Simkania negevensis (strain ATCC VR-1471 / DSM 27360 / Z) TaxID=331113 RepID=F8L7Q3_SIMNZ|nr:DUF502 domain-containing protein [Simkania negevensis]CCB88792.1 putative uncharacterized protein [Simkania negevensis Z]